MAQVPTLSEVEQQLLALEKAFQDTSAFSRLLWLEDENTLGQKDRSIGQTLERIRSQKKKQETYRANVLKALRAVKSALLYARNLDVYPALLGAWTPAKWITFNVSENADDWKQFVNESCRRREQQNVQSAEARGAQNAERKATQECATKIQSTRDQVSREKDAEINRIQNDALREKNACQEEMKRAQELEKQKRNAALTQLTNGNYFEGGNYQDLIKMAVDKTLEYLQKGTQGTTPLNLVANRVIEFANAMRADVQKQQFSLSKHIFPPIMSAFGRLRTENAELRIRVQNLESALKAQSNEIESLKRAKPDQKGQTAQAQSSPYQVRIQSGFRTITVSMDIAEDTPAEMKRNAIRREKLTAFYSQPIFKDMVIRAEQKSYDPWFDVGKFVQNSLQDREFRAAKAVGNSLDQLNEPYDWAHLIDLCHDIIDDKLYTVNFEVLRYILIGVLGSDQERKPYLGSRDMRYKKTNLQDGTTNTFISLFQKYGPDLFEFLMLDAPTNFNLQKKTFSPWLMDHVWPGFARFLLKKASTDAVVQKGIKKWETLSISAKRSIGRVLGLLLYRFDVFQETDPVNMLLRDEYDATEVAVLDALQKLIQSLINSGEPIPKLNITIMEISDVKDSEYDHEDSVPNEEFMTQAEAKQDTTPDEKSFPMDWYNAARTAAENLLFARSLTDSQKVAIQKVIPDAKDWTTSFVKNKIQKIFDDLTQQTVSTSSRGARARLEADINSVRLLALVLERRSYAQAENPLLLQKYLLEKRVDVINLLISKGIVPTPEQRAIKAKDLGANPDMQRQVKYDILVWKQIMPLPRQLSQQLPRPPQTQQQTGPAAASSNPLKTQQTAQKGGRVLSWTEAFSRRLR